MFRAGLIFLSIWSLKILVALARLLVCIQRLSSDAVFRIEEGRSLHDATHDVLVAWFEQVQECVGDIFADALRVFCTVLVWSGEHAVARLRHSVAMMLIVLLGLVMADSATVDDAYGCELGVLSQDLGVVVW